MRWRLLACLSLLLAVAPAPAARAAVPVLVVDGKGFGHGVGMAQDGAYWMGRAGQSVNQILGHFYPGTSLGRAGGTIAVAVFDVPNKDTVVSFPSGGQVQDAESGTQSAGFPVSVGPGGSVHVWFDGAYHAQAISGSTQHAAAAGPSAAQAKVVDYQVPMPTTTTTFVILPTTSTLPKPSPTTTRPPPPTTTPPPPPAPAPAVATSGRPLWSVPANGSVSSLTSGHQYRGVLSMTATGPLHIVNHIDVEQYLRGMGEVRDPSWPQASLKTQAIAARTYALRSIGGELCADDRCQVYLGAGAEYAAMDKAVSDTKGVVVTYGGGLASTVYSANAGGISASAPEGFGASSPNYPYLKPGPYTTSDPDPWTVKIALTDLAARFAAAGPLTGAHVAQTGPSGRALSVSLDGPNGASTVVDAHQFASGLGLKSTLISLRVDNEDVAPAPPAPADLIQVPPDQLAPAPPADAVPPVIAALPSGPVKAILPGAGHNDRVRWIAFALLLMGAWAVASTYYGYGIVPANARNFLGTQAKRVWPRT